MLYPYSYTVNEKICGYYQASLRLGAIVHPSNKILVIDEASLSLDDGCWAWVNYNPAAAVPLNILSNRHVKPQELTKDPKAGRGNVCFADFHVASIERAESITPAYCDPLDRTLP